MFNPRILDQRLSSGLFNKQLVILKTKINENGVKVVKELFFEEILSNYYELLAQNQPKDWTVFGIALRLNNFSNFYLFSIIIV